MTKAENEDKSVDKYIGAFPGEVKKVLQQIRGIIHQVAPEAQETISYGIPAFRLGNKYWIYFAGWRDHVSLYPIPSGTAAFKREIASYVAGKGTLKFPLNKPIPYPLIRKIVGLHIARSA